jgi:beta-fructofuranosidase
VAARRRPAALLADRRWYKTLHVDPPRHARPGTGQVSETWRDPLVLPDPEGDGWHLLLTHAPSEPRATTTGSWPTLAASTSPPGP